MKRLEILARTIVGADDVPRPEAFVSRQRLTELIDLVRFVSFPEHLPAPSLAVANRPETAVDANANGTGVLREIAGAIAAIETIVAEQLECAIVTTAYEAALKSGAEKPETAAAAAAAVAATSNTTTRHSALPASAIEAARTKAAEVANTFVTERLAAVRELLRLDLEALFEKDVAAESRGEVVLCYPGLVCMTHQRTAHALYRLGAPNCMTRLLTEMAHTLTGIDIHPHASIGPYFFVDHGSNIVIGATAIIGSHVMIYQGVTLGARSFPTDKATGARIRGLPRHPILEDHVTVYANAVVLGRITIGRGSTIAGNVWVTKSVPPNTVVKQSETVTVKGGAGAIFEESYGSGI